MTTMEVEIISRETIKPFTSTSPHNRTYNLSFLEQVNPRTYVPVVYFYPKEASETPDFLTGGDKSNQLKKSLSETLAKYYPFAGRIRDRVSIDCNDDGVTFIEARIKNIELSEILEHPKDEVLDLLFTDNLQWNDDSNINVLLAVQVSFFDCGGMAVGICMSHKIADTSTMINFINDWAAVARNNKKCDQYVPSPEFISATVFPRCDLPLSPEAMIEKSNCVTKRFVFDATKIAALKAIVTEKLQNPTRVEAVTAFIHSRAISALRSTSGSSSNPTTFIQTVNLRARMVPPLPQSSAGSMIWFFTVSTAEDGVVELHDLVGQMKQRMTKFCDTYVRKFRAKDQWPSIFKECIQESRKPFSKGNLVIYRCSSWCRFPVYEADFGWGKPIWVTIASCAMKNAVFMIDTRDGEGIEAYVNLEKQELDVFERDAELLAFASLNPSVI